MVEFAAVTAGQKKRRWEVEIYITSSSEGHSVRIAPYRNQFGHLAFPMTPEELTKMTGIKFGKEYFGDEYFSVPLPYREQAEELKAKVERIFKEGKEQDGKTDPVDGIPIEII